MQHYEKSKRRRKVALIVSYTIMTLAVIALSILCIMLVMGYRFDISNKKVERGALIQFASYPVGASVVLDNMTLSTQTPTKEDVEVSDHHVVISKKGYRDWKKQFTLRAGEVRWLNYARLIPTNVETSTVKQLSGLASQLTSPNRNWLLISQKAEEPHFLLADLRDAKSIKFTDIVIPTEILTMPEESSHSFKIVEWDFGSKFALVQHNFGDNQHEYLRINRSDVKDIVNITTKFGMNIQDVHFSGSNAFYGVENGNLRKFDLAASSISEPVAKNVVQMKLYGDKDMVVVEHIGAEFRVSSVINDKLHTVNTYDDTLKVNVELTKYYRERYVAITRGGSFELIKNPEKTVDQGFEKVITLTFPGELRWVDASSGGRFIIAGNGTQFMTYDIELAKRSDVNLPGTVADPSTPPLQWLDDSLLVSTADNKLRISDFDGDNQQIVTDALALQPVSLSANSELLYSFSRLQDGTPALRASSMVVKN